MWAARTNDPDEVGPALRSAWSEVLAGRSALVDAIIRPGIV
jgi:hypothetical protein